MHLLPSLLLAAAAPLAACDLCALHDVPEFGAGSPGLAVGVFTQWTHFATLQEDGDAIADEADQRLDSSITQLQAAWRFDDRFALRAMVPWIHRSFRRPDGFAIDEDSESGIGDATLAGEAALLSRHGDAGALRLTALLGMKAPTGSSDRLREEAHEVEVPGAPESGIHGHDLALGSGSWDLLLGLSAAGARGRWFATADAQYAVRSKGDHHYRYADDLVWSAAAGGFLIAGDDRRLGLAARLSGERKGKDEHDGEAADDTAITSLAVGPEANLAWHDRFQALLGVDVPVVQRNSAVQIVPDWRLRAGMVWGF